MTLKGAEIILRTATGGCEWHDMRLTAYHNDVFVTIGNNSIDTFRPSDNYFVEQAPRNDWVGRSAIFGPKGVVLAEADKFETKRRAVFDMERSEEHTSELQSLMRLSYAVFCLKKKKKKNTT